ncbi:MAG: hypothetical protein AAF549_07950 [Pseudomonadota bacterium]
MSVAPNVLEFQREIAASEGLRRGVRLRGLWHLNVTFDIRNSAIHPNILRADEAFLAKIVASVPRTKYFGGGRALDWLHSLADQYRVPIKLYSCPIEHKALDDQNLDAMYLRRGYTRMSTTGLMIRQPQ